MCIQTRQRIYESQCPCIRQAMKPLRQRRSDSEGLQGRTPLTISVYGSSREIHSNFCNQVD